MTEIAQKFNRSDVEDAVMNALDDVRLLELVLSNASDSPRSTVTGDGAAMVVSEELFLAWQRACNHVADSVRRLEGRFYAMR